MSTYLQVAMCYPLAMAIVEGACDVHEDLTCLGLRIVILFYDSLKELATVHGLHDKIRRVAIVEDVTQMDYVPVTKPLHDANLLIKPFHVLMREILVRHTLHSPLGSVRLVRRQFHNPKASLAQRLADVVALRWVATRRRGPLADSLLFRSHLSQQCGRVSEGREWGSSVCIWG